MSKKTVFAKLNELLEYSMSNKVVFINDFFQLLSEIDFFDNEFKDLTKTSFIIKFFEKRNGVNKLMKDFDDNMDDEQKASLLLEYINK